MLLAVAVENTRTLVGLVHDDDRGGGVGKESNTVKRHWWVRTDPRRTADEWSVLLDGLLASESPLTGLAVCSAVPSALQELRDLAGRYYPGVPSVVVEPGVKTGLPVLVDNPREVGTDRIANALAAVHLYGPPCIVVDIGTAITIDVVNPAGAFVGGVIAPGIETATDALGEVAAQLRRVELTTPRTLVARNTVEALQSGAVHGFAALVDGLVTRIRTDRSLEASTVVATGALAPLLIPHCTTITQHSPYLPLLGLYRAHTRNH